MEQQTNQTPISPESQSSFQPEIPKKSGLPKWTSVLILAVAIIAVGLVSYGAYRYFVPQTEPAELPMVGEEEPTPSSLPISEPTDETADWQVYRNEEYGFEVKYPKEANYLKPKTEGIVFIGIKPRTGYGYGITVDVIENPQNLSADEWYFQYYTEEKEKTEAEGVPFLLFPDGEYIQLNTYSAYKTTAFGFDHRKIYLHISHNNYIYKIHYRDESANDPDWNRHKEKIDRILSTFKFIK